MPDGQKSNKFFPNSTNRFARITTSNLLESTVSRTAGTIEANKGNKGGRGRGGDAQDFSQLSQTIYKYYKLIQPN